MISPNVYFRIEPIISCLFHIVVVIMFSMAIFRKFSWPFFMILISSILSVPVSLSFLILKQLSSGDLKVEVSKKAVREIYTLITILEPSAVIFLFIALLMLVIEYFKIDSLQSEKR